jgi:hypothetical protein
VTTSKIHLAPNGGSKIVIDGVDIADRVTKITIEADYDRTEAVVRLGRIADTEVHAHTIVDNATRTALLKLGWTPPGETAPPAVPANTPRPEHLGLADLITRLEREHEAHPGKHVRTGFHRAQSYRGYYHDLAFEIAHDVTVTAMLDTARQALGATFQGWKGGDYTMGEYTQVWLIPEPGDCGESLGAVLLELLLAQAGDA